MFNNIMDDLCSGYVGYIFECFLYVCTNIIYIKYRALFLDTSVRQYNKLFQLLIQFTTYKYIGRHVLSYGAHGISLQNWHAVTGAEMDHWYGLTTLFQQEATQDSKAFKAVIVLFESVSRR